MSEERLLYALSHVDDHFITESAPGQIPPKKIPWVKWTSFAACVTFSVFVCFAIALSFVRFTRYQRISFDRQTLSESLENHISADTKILNTVDAEFPSTLPIYQITERNITQQEYEQFLISLNIPNDPQHLALDGNSLTYNLASYTDFSRGYFNMSDDQLEKIAWDTFRKLPFIVGDYEYLGITSNTTLNDKHGDHITRVGVTFSRIVSDCRVLGEDRCTLYFDGSGLVALNITLFDYEEIGTMEVVPLEDAQQKLATPDDFSIDTNAGTKEIANTLEIDNIDFLLVNQYSEGCTILQPIYNFTGTATLETGNRAEFSSKVIAIPASYTYDNVLR